MIRARKKTTLRLSFFFWALTYSFISSSSGIISMVISGQSEKPVAILAIIV